MTSGNAFSLLRVQSLHALAYCERLFYLEEVERIRLADASVYAGRRLHVELEREEDGDWHTLDLQSDNLGLRGRVDCLRRRDGAFIPYEHKRGRAARQIYSKQPGKRLSSKENPHCAWPSDKLQVAAYTMLIEEFTGEQISEARVRYHQDKITVRVPIDAVAREEVIRAIARARDLSASVERPPVTSNERLCVKCSLAPACLPEEARRATQLSQIKSDEPVCKEIEQAGENVEIIREKPDLSASPALERKGSAQSAQHKALSSKTTIRLFPADDQRQSLHVVTAGARIGRAGDQIEVVAPGETPKRHPSHEIGQVVLHGFAQITTQALRLCAEKEIAVHWVTQGGSYIGSFASGAGGVQRRIRQYEALRDPA